MRRGLILGILGAIAVFAVSAVFDTSLARTAVAVGSSMLVLWLGWTMIAGMAAPVPEPPDPGELRKVKLTYRCSICGAEVRMTVAAAEDPEPPRHCLEDMDLLTPIE